MARGQELRQGRVRRSISQQCSWYRRPEHSWPRQPPEKPSTKQVLSGRRLGAEGLAHRTHGATPSQKRTNAQSRDVSHSGRLPRSPWLRAVETAILNELAPTSSLLGPMQERSDSPLTFRSPSQSLSIHVSPIPGQALFRHDGSLACGPRTGATDVMEVHRGDRATTLES